MQTLTFAYLGNFQPDHSTENHVARALRNVGHQVVQIQEGHTDAGEVPDRVLHANADVFLWTQTYSLAEQGGTLDERVEMVRRLQYASPRIPTVGYHLDRWWGLDRADQIGREPFFHVDLLCTADGGHDDAWQRAGINHMWMPPAVSEGECVPAEPDAQFRADVAFVGNWRGGYHREWGHRRKLIRWLRSNYRRRVRMWPEVGKPAVRGEALRALYATTKVNVGDSCLVGGTARYWSDRIPETLGRGGFLLHPHVDGLADHYTDGDHLRTWELGDWGQLRSLIDHYLAHPEERAHIASTGRKHVLAHHTYEQRMRTLTDVLVDRGMVS